MFLYYVSYFGQTVNTSREKFEYLVRRQEGAGSEGQHLLSLRLQPQLPKSLNNLAARTGRVNRTFLNISLGISREGNTQ